MSQVSFVVKAIGEPAVAVAGIRVLSNGVWYNVYPEGEQAKCKAGGNFVVAYGAENVGDGEGLLFGRILGPNGEVLHSGSSGVPILPGNIAFWEPTLVMPNYDYALKVQVSTSYAFTAVATAQFGVAINGELTWFDQIWAEFIAFLTSLGVPADMLPPKPPLPALPIEGG